MLDKAIPLRSRASNSAFEGKDWGDSNQGVVDTPQAERFSPPQVYEAIRPQRSGSGVGFGRRQSDAESRRRIIAFVGCAIMFTSRSGELRDAARAGLA
ncbi:hypothetical protein RIB2604_02111630 [Aspergillus luchuensis]|uniref:Uncharacterized protein n=1 Tax=Aspergillus kawachii TaxID=1069201 RepID=A0A146FNQ5_ASPKA|nr:hypothetical protein RIB2604_02111630 [Aspergillus luchuensis]